MVDLILAIRNYFEAILLDGDYLNDWLTHLPAWLADILVTIGQFLAMLLESAPITHL